MLSRWPIGRSEKKSSARISGAAINKKGTTIMLNFLPTYIRFNHVTRTVHVTAECEGRRKIDVLLSRAAIEYLADAENLEKEDSFNAVARNKEQLQYAAAVALARYGDDCRAVAVELSDLTSVLPGGAGARLGGSSVTRH
jgi:hypothetical protein